MKKPWVTAVASDTTSTTIPTRYGNLQIPNVSNDLIGRFLQRYGEWAWSECCFVATALEAGSKVLDGGAFIGTFSLGLSQCALLESVSCIEANADIIPYLRNNVENNMTVPTMVIDAILCGKRAPAPAVEQANNIGATSFLRLRDQEVDHPQNTLLLSQARSKYGPFDLIKLDVEGMELEIIDEDREFLATGRTALWIECNETFRSLEIASLVLSWGLPVFYFAWPSFNSENIKGDPEPIFHFGYESGLLVSPKRPPILLDSLAKQRCILKRIDSVDALKLAMWRTPRWGMPDWPPTEPESIAGIAGHALLGNKFSDYLTPDWKEKADSRNHLVTAQQELSVAQDQASRLLGKLQESELELDRSRASIDTILVEAAQSRTAAKLERKKRLEVEQARQDMAASAAIERHKFALELESLKAELNRSIEQLEQERELLDAESTDRATIEQALISERTKLSAIKLELESLRVELNRSIAQLEQERKLLDLERMSRTTIEQALACERAKLSAIKVEVRSLTMSAIEEATRKLIQPELTTSKSSRLRMARFDLPPSLRKVRDRLIGSFAPSGPLHRNDRKAMQPYFDEAYYLEQNPDVRAASIDPLVHFHVHGWQEGRNPNPTFNVRYYLSKHADVAAAGINPLLHYAYSGRKEGRDISFDPSALKDLTEQFDPTFYLERNPDVRLSRFDPLTHFDLFGWKEGRDPNSSFDTKYYLTANPDVAAAGINPLLHYVWAGQREGRPARKRLKSEREVIAASFARSETLDSKQEQDISHIRLMDRNEIAEVMKKLADAPRFIISISHDDYAENIGGVQNVIGDEAACFNSRGISYLQISPATPMSQLRPAGFSPAVSLRLNGEKLGQTDIRTFSDCWNSSDIEIPPLAVIVHHLMGHSSEEIGALIDLIQPTERIFWAHDFFAACPSYNLLRNGVSFCGAPPPKSNACLVCASGSARAEHLERMSDLLDRNWTVLAPSQSALDTFCKSTGITAAKTAVVPLASLQLEDCVDLDISRQLRIAHVGYRTFHKGWPIFEELARQFANDERYAFFHLGSEETGTLGNVQHVPVAVTQADRGAMIRALKETSIDVVLTWPAWPETFNFVVHESIAAGAFILTHRNSGNIWPALLANSPKQGLALEDVEALHHLFANGGLEESIRQADKRHGSLTVNPGTAAWLLSEEPVAYE